jgi:uncharacterized membrane protein
MDDAEAWALEERFWTGRAPAFDKLLDPACLMAFPGMGVMRAADVLESLAGAPRWASVEMTDRALGRAGAGVVVLGYAAEGRREGAAPYRCLCTSTYRSDGGAWKLVQHQQTPAG